MAAVHAELEPVAGARQSRDMLVDLVGDGHFVLLGEASHGTHESGESCEREVVDQLVDMQQHVQEHAPRAALLAENELFHAEQSACTVKAAEEYYRTMLNGRVSSVESPPLTHGRHTGRPRQPPQQSAWRAGEDRRVGAQLARGRQPRDGAREHR